MFRRWLVRVSGLEKGFILAVFMLGIQTQPPTEAKPPTELVQVVTVTGYRSGDHAEQFVQLLFGGQMLAGGDKRRESKILSRLRLSRSYIQRPWV